MPDKTAELNALIAALTHAVTSKATADIATLTRAVTHDANGGDTTWTAFLHRWHELHSTSHITSRDLHRSAPTDNPHTDPAADIWNGTFPTDPYGRIPSVKSIGRILTAHINRWHGNHVLRSAADPRMNARVYWVETHNA